MIEWELYVVTWSMESGVLAAIAVTGIFVVDSP